MPRWDSFGSSLAFAALAAAGLPVAVTFGGALFGSEGAARLYAIAAAGAYAVGLCPDRSRRVAALAFVALAGVILALLPLDLRSTAVGAAGLAAASHFARGGLLALCLALWGYFLVQSGYFLIGARGPGAGEAALDPFDRARAQLLRLLEDDPI